MGNILRIVIGLGGLFAAGWSARRTMAQRRAQGAGGERASFGRTFAILGATAVGVALTLLI